jgi:hypothetical protein
MPRRSKPRKPPASLNSEPTTSPVSARNAPRIFSLAGDLFELSPAARPRRRRGRRSRWQASWCRRRTPSDRPAPMPIARAARWCRRDRDREIICHYALPMEIGLAAEVPHGRPATNALPRAGRVRNSASARPALQRALASILSLEAAGRRCCCCTATRKLPGQWLRYSRGLARSRRGRLRPSHRQRSFPPRRGAGRNLRRLARLLCPGSRGSAEILTHSAPSEPGRPFRAVRRARGRPRRIYRATK